ncbi:MAG TPA: maleylpyruvate isomerase family mycothiol-dependent enzyme [Kutzneria sp.]|nr:maleylpyruvate isomerase family mycothiol-dependent enzyme [Kutzneria sp.]
MAETYAVYCDAIEREVARIGEVGRTHDLAAEVPCCPGWTLGDVVKHVGVLQQWFAAMIERQSAQRLPFGEVDFGVPAEVADYPEWLVARQAEVGKVLRAADPDAAMYTWGPGGEVRFWVRRMLMECLVHRYDAELAAGELTAVDPALAADGVEEFLVNLPSAEGFAPDVANLRGSGQTIGFGVWGTEVDWTVRLDADSFGLVSAVDDPDATVSAETAEALLLLVYGRIGRDDARIRIEGEADLLDKWFTHSKF